jgi:ankyrin repeat protein
LDGSSLPEEDDGMCISKKSCKEGDASKVAQAKLAKCSHCGAKNWNILGDGETGYVLTEGDGKTCMVREQGSTKAMTAPCDSDDHPYTPLQLQFASAADIKTMSSAGARMIGAASDGDKKAIQAMLASGDVDVNVRDWDELTALIPAASAGHLDICKLLIKEGIDVNAKDKDGITALMEASIMGQMKIVVFLLENGAEVDGAANSEVTALWLAASEGQSDVMKLLLDKGADATNTRVDGISALMTASVGGHDNAVKMLLANGADPTIADKDGLTPLMNAAESGNVSVLKLIAEHVKDPSYLNSLSSTGFNAIIIAAAHGHAAAMEYLLEAGADVNGASDNQVTALMYAAASNHLDAMKVLLGEKGKADVDARHTNGGTALLESATGGAVDAMKLLIENGASVDFYDDDGVTPLMAIASQGSVEGQTLVIDALKKTMSDEVLAQHINKFSFSGGSSVMFSAAGGHVDCTQQLIDLGADIKAIARATPEYLEKLGKMIEEGKMVDEEPHVDGVTAVHVAAQGGHLAAVELLLAQGAEATVKDDEERTALTLAIKGNYGEVAAALVKGGADPNTPYVDEDGVSHDLLFDAIMVENEEFAKLLIEKGANIYHRDEKKVTTLLQASHRGFADIVKMLLEKHAAAGDSKNNGYLDATSDEGVAPLIAASSEGHPEVVAALVAGGVNVNLKDQDETSALMAASARGHLEVVKEILKAGASVNDQNQDGHTALMFAYNGKNQVETLWERFNQFVDGSENKEADDSGTGPTIRQALDDHIALVDLLVKSGADSNLKDKEGHTAKDFDFHPDADTEVLEKQAKTEKVRDESSNEL